MMCIYFLWMLYFSVCVCVCLSPFFSPCRQYPVDKSRVNEFGESGEEVTQKTKKE